MWHNCKSLREVQRCCINTVTSFVWQKVLFHETGAVFMIFFGLCSSVKEPWKRVIFCKIKVKYLLFLQSLLLESWKYFSLPLVCLWILPWAGRTWLQPLVIKSFPFKVQNIVHAIHMHLHTFTNACTVWVTICICNSYFL